MEERQRFYEYLYHVLRVESSKSKVDTAAPKSMRDTYLGRLNERKKALIRLRDETYYNQQPWTMLGECTDLIPLAAKQATNTRTTSPILDRIRNYLEIVYRQPAGQISRAPNSQSNFAAQTDKPRPLSATVATQTERNNVANPRSKSAPKAFRKTSQNIASSRSHSAPVRTPILARRINSAMSQSSMDILEIHRKCFTQSFPRIYAKTTYQSKLATMRCYQKPVRKEDLISSEEPSALQNSSTQSNQDNSFESSSSSSTFSSQTSLADPNNELSLENSRCASDENNIPSVIKEETTNSGQDSEKLSLNNTLIESETVKSSKTKMSSEKTVKNQSSTEDEKNKSTQEKSTQHSVTTKYRNNKRPSTAINSRHRDKLAERPSTTSSTSLRNKSKSQTTDSTETRTSNQDNLDNKIDQECQTDSPPKLPIRQSYTSCVMDNVRSKIERLDFLAEVTEILLAMDSVSERTTKTVVDVCTNAWSDRLGSKSEATALANALLSSIYDGYPIEALFSQ